MLGLVYRRLQFRTVMLKLQNEFSKLAGIFVKYLQVGVVSVKCFAEIYNHANLRPSAGGGLEGGVVG